MKRFIGAPARDDSGATLVEFALIAPVLVLTLLGVFEMGYNFYVQANLQGSVQKAARSATLEGSASIEEQIDANVTRAVRAIVPNATITFTRDSYSSFSEVGQPEDFTDINDDGICNDGEPFEDANGNGMWDRDRGKQGFGGARDVVLYTVHISYPRAFAMGQLLGLGDKVNFDAQTVLRNQPWDRQDTSVSMENCT